MIASAAPLQKTFGNYVRELRQKSGLKVEQLAERSGFSIDRLNSIERGEVNLSIGTLLVLAMSLDTTFSDMLYQLSRQISAPAKMPKARILMFPTSRNKTMAQPR